MFSMSYQKLSQLYKADSFPWVIIGIGIALRLIRYLYNPTLWSDEAVVAEDIINRTFIEFLQPSLDWSSKHPPGFLMLEKFVTIIFGNSEYSFRLIPLLSGCISLYLIYRLAQTYLKHAAVPIAIGLLALADPLIFQSSNIKPYSGDLAAGLVLLMAATHLRSVQVTALYIFLFGLMGAAMIWFSNTSVFVMAGVGLSLVIFYLRRKDWMALIKVSVIFSMWAISFVVYYYTFVLNLIKNTGFNLDQIVQFEKAVIPFPPTSLADIKLLMDTFFEMFTFPVGLTFNGLAAMGFLVGCIAMYRSRKEDLFIILSPVLITFAAAILNKYAFTGRLIIFLVPFIVLIIAEGTDYVREKLSVHSSAAGAVILCVLFIYPLSWGAYHAKNPSSHEELRPILSYLEENWRDGDILYVHYYAQYPFTYYAKYHPERYDFAGDDYVIGIAPRGWYRTWRKQDVIKYYGSHDTSIQTNEEILQEYVKDMNRLRGQERVWFLFTSTLQKDGLSEEKYFKYHLLSIGRQEDFFGKTGVAAVYLFDLSNKIKQKN